MQTLISSYPSHQEGFVRAWSKWDIENDLKKKKKEKCQTCGLPLSWPVSNQEDVKLYFWVSEGIDW